MIVPSSKDENSHVDQIQTWIKNNAKWWTEGTIGDDSFIPGVQWLIANGMIDVTDHPHNNISNNAIVSQDKSTIPINE